MKDWFCVSSHVAFGIESNISVQNFLRWLMQVLRGLCLPQVHNTRPFSKQLDHLGRLKVNRAFLWLWQSH